MRARPAQSKSRPGPNEAGPFDSSATDQSARAIDVHPSGWVRRDSGLVVPTHREPGRGRSVVGLLVVVALLISPVANGVSEVSRAGSDAVSFVRLLFATDAQGPTTTPAVLTCTDH